VNDLAALADLNGNGKFDSSRPLIYYEAGEASITASPTRFEAGLSVECGALEIGRDQIRWAKYAHRFIKSRGIA
jgi:hypothetical protein